MNTYSINNKTLPSCMAGTWAWGKGANGSKMVFGKYYSEAELEKAFEKAYSLGFKMWDTAEIYGMGNSEKILGGFLQGKTDAIISTKFNPPKKYTSGAAEKALCSSLERLGIKFADLYWLHQPINIKENLGEFAKLEKQGKIKSIGVSNCSLEQIKEAEKILESHGTKLYAVQNHFSLLTDEKQKEILSYCKKKNILYFGYMVLEQGALSGKYSEKNPFPLFSMRRFLFGKGKLKKIKDLLAYQKKLAEKYSVRQSQIPIIWAIAKGVIPIVGLTNEAHSQALSAVNKVSLSDDEIKTLEKIAKKSGVITNATWE